MSLIGGYYSFTKRKYNSEQIFRCLNHFQCLSGESEDNDIGVYEYSYGHIFVRRKKKVNSLVSAGQDKHRNILAVLGFFSHDNWDDWDFENGQSKLRDYYTDHYPKELTQAEGEFTAVFFHARSGTLHIVNDRFAARPMYYFSTKESLYFCSNLFFLTQLSNQAVELDPLGIMQMFYYSHTAGQYTHLRDYYRLLPASHFTVQDKVVKERHYWTLKYTPDFDLEPLSYAKTTFDELQRSIQIRGRLSPRTLLPLSGGLDSRSIAACIPKEMNIPAMTMVSEERFSSDQYAVAAMVAESLSLEHSTSKLSPGISKCAQDLIHLTCGLVPLQHSMKSIQGPFGQFDIFLDGGPGDVLVGSYISNMYYTLPQKYNELLITSFTLDHCLNRFCLLFNKDFMEAICKRFREEAFKELEDLEGDTVAERISLWKMRYRQPAFTFAQPPHCHPFGTSVYPHLGYGYIDKILKLPPLWLFNKQFYKYMIYQCAPELRHIPYANTGELLSRHIRKPTASLLDYKLYAAKRRLNVFYHKIFQKQHRPKEKMIEFYNMQTDKYLLSELREMLLGYPVMADFFKIDSCVKYINHFESGTNIPEVSFSPEQPIGFWAAILYAYRYTRSRQNQL